MEYDTFKTIFDSHLYSDYRNLYTVKYEQSKFKYVYKAKIEFVYRLVAIIWGCWGMTNGIFNFLLKNYIGF